MKRRILAAGICIVMAVSFCGCGTKAADSPESTTVAAGSGQQIANPVVDCGNDMEKAAKITGFKLKLPALSNYSISVIGGNVIEVKFPKDESTDIFFRKSETEVQNFSGIYLSTKPVTETFNQGVEVQAQIENGKYYSLTFGAEDGYFCVGCTKGLSKDEMYSYLKELYDSNKK
ncbi:MAG: hypothetical protein PUE71_04555 [Clostridia bacterium]|nr:hypothetical protein [Clostridia bacterium]